MDADRALQSYKIANNLVNTGKGLLSAEQLSILNTQLTNARVAASEAKARLDRINQMDSGGIPSAERPDLASKPTAPRAGAITSALSHTQLVQLNSQYRGLSKKATQFEVS